MYAKLLFWVSVPLGILCSHLPPVTAQEGPLAPQEGTFADVATLADRAGLVARVNVTTMAKVERPTIGVRAGFARFYIEAKTGALLTGKRPLGERVKYLVDLPVDSLGEAPNLEKQNFFIFANRVPSSSEELQLVTPTAQLPWSPAGGTRLRRILRSMVSPDAPPKITGVRELTYVPGALAGQGRTQIFLDTATGTPASITVRHRPGTKTTWGVSFSELAGRGDKPPSRGTLEWFRLACSLPSHPNSAANLSTSESERRQAAADYHYVVSDLRPCLRNF